MRTAFLQPAGTNTEKAAKMLAQKRDQSFEPILKPSPKAVARSVASGEAEYGVIAYHNSTGGLVQQCLDAIYQCDLHIVGAQRLQVKHSLGTCPGNTDFGIIYSHQQALAQCEDYLWTHYPDAHQQAEPSTAAAAEKVKKMKTGIAIAPAATLKNLELDILAEDAVKTHTDFLLVAKTPNTERQNGTEYWTMVALNTPMDREGLLFDITGLIKTSNLNLANIHSRPSMNNPAQSERGIDPQMFYLEIMAHQDDKNLTSLLECFQLYFKKFFKDENFVRLLGSYPRPSTTIKNQ